MSSPPWEHPPNHAAQKIKDGMSRFSEVGSSWLWIRVKCILCSGSHQTGSQSFSLLLLIWSSPLFTFSFSSQTIFTFLSRLSLSSPNTEQDLTINFQKNKHDAWIIVHCPSYPWCLVVSWMCQIIPWCVLTNKAGNAWTPPGGIFFIPSTQDSRSTICWQNLFWKVTIPHTMIPYHHDTIPWYHIIMIPYHDTVPCHTMMRNAPNTRHTQAI